MKHKTSQLDGALLDAAVAKAENDNPAEGDPLPYSRVWSLAGQIIERERVATEPNDDFADPKRSAWLAWLEHPARPDGVQRSHACGQTPLIAAMRAYVASRLGEEVELP